MWYCPFTKKRHQRSNKAVRNTTDWDRLEFRFELCLWYMTGVHTVRADRNIKDLSGTKARD